jgi:hypothetical protein
VSPSCVAEKCTETAVASLDGLALCRPHFLAVAYQRLESMNEQMREPNFHANSPDLSTGLLEQCMREATNIACAAELPSNLERAQILDILLWASELYGRLRRGPRVRASIPVLLRHEGAQNPWEEKTQTRQLSVHGFSFACRHELRNGDMLTCVRLDTGRRVEARVVWARANESGETEAGVGFMTDIDFWGIEVNVGKAVLPAKFG